MPMQPKRLADRAANAIALDGVPRCLDGHRQPQARPAFIVEVHRHSEEAVPEAPAVCINCVEFAFTAQAPLLGVSQPLSPGAIASQVRGLRG